MIRVGLSGWSHHKDLYDSAEKQENKLQTYSKHFSIVELDNTFNAIQPERNFIRWVRDTPDHFSFIIKAYQGMTGHLRGKNPYSSKTAMYAAFKDSIEHVKRESKLKAVLFQYPPWFECNKTNVDLLRETKERMNNTPCALEFHHQSWFLPDMRERTLSFMEREGWIHSICDESQAAELAILMLLQSTNADLSIVRMNGRNAFGCNQVDQSNWRRECYLQWKDKLVTLQKETREICVIFNNNSREDSAMNAKELMRLLDEL